TNVTVTTDPQTGVTTVAGPNGTAVVRQETGTDAGTGTAGTGTGSTGTPTGTSITPTGTGTSAGTNTNTNAGANTNTNTNTNTSAGGPADPEDGPRFSDDSLYMDSASEAAALLETAGADIRYTVSNAAPVRIGAGDLRRFFLQSYPNGTLERLRLLGIPSAGRLYYNYYSSSRYGSPFPRLISASDTGKQDYYLSPAAESQFSLWELYFSPAAGTNACALIPFTAYGADASQSVRGTILISATNQPVGEVYGVTTRDTPVGFPTEPIRTALAAAAGTLPASIRLLDLPATVAGTLYEEGSDSPAAAGTGKGYAFPAGTDNLHFVPAPGFTGTVSIPYAALDAAGTAYAAGAFSIGVVNNLRQFPDVDASSWCVKYVTELADAGVLGGYPDGTFQPDRAVTYGAALKLILLSAGYPEQQEGSSNTSDVFARYLEFARAQGIVSGTVNLSAPITRLQVARLAAAAMKLSGGSYGSGVFTDTSDPAVLALHAMGILNGYEVNGVSEFRPGNTLTRGQLAAIVWRIRNYR
ncbi:MAG: S-layer homology domain-containing protein, partial [Oscillibacter sp.]|nr:S-layer homology domain-containing protein [Oscillibacter sp.]